MSTPPIGSDGLRRYGNRNLRNERMEDKARCIESTSSDGWHFHQCARKRLDGGEYCGLHDPKRKAERRAKRGPTKYARECAARAARADLERRTVELLRELAGHCDYWQPSQGCGCSSCRTRALLAELEARK